MNPILSFSEKLIAWQKQYGRHDLAWQVADPYQIWLSEIMLQQTQVITVKDYFPRFMAKFPTVQALAHAEQDEVLALWQGLGYYSRARNLHFAAQQVCRDFDGVFPQNRQDLMQLKGVGRSTAAAIAAFAFSQRETILDGNVKRILCRIFALDGTGKAFENQLWDFAEKLLPQQHQDMKAYTQGLMDLGALVCQRKPNCVICPMADICEAKKQNRIAELPRKKAIKVQPMSLFWLILHNESRIFLQKREQKGIWSGLYCVPCFETRDDLHDFVKKHCMDWAGLCEHQTISHRLTHRVLSIIPYEYKGDLAVRLSGGIWVEWTDLANWGLPKPLQYYLQQKMIKSDFIVNENKKTTALPTL